MDRVEFDRFVKWLIDNKMTITPDTWELRYAEFKIGYRSGR